MEVMVVGMVAEMEVMVVGMVAEMEGDGGRDWWQRWRRWW